MIISLLAPDATQLTGSVSGLRAFERPLSTTNKTGSLPETHTLSVCSVQSICTAKKALHACRVPETGLSNCSLQIDCHSNSADNTSQW